MTEQVRADQDPLALKTCPECGYSLEALPREGVCPECGERYDQQYVVLFGETPEGISRRASWGMLLLFTTCAVATTSMSIRQGEFINRPVFMMLSFLLVYVVLWSTRRASHKREIIFQVWLDDRGFAVRRPKSETTFLARAERRFRFLWPVVFIPSFGTLPKELSVAFVVATLAGIALAVGVAGLLDVPSRRRRVDTGDARQPTLTAWERNDTATIDPARLGTARLRITSRSYVGKWKWQEWQAVDAVVRVTYEQVTELRERTGRWISARWRGPDREDQTHA